VRTEIRAAFSPDLLSVEGLAVEFTTDRGRLPAVAGITYRLAKGKTLGVVGESGCGKSMTALAVLGLTPDNGRVSGAIHFDGIELTALDEAGWSGLRGKRVAMIFQEPMTALNPVTPIGTQIGEVLVLHEGLSAAAGFDRAIELLHEVGIPAPAERARAYPHQLSGGMRQRAMIAMALACRPQLLIADEPTTALDVTIQAQILELMLELQDQIGMAIQFISHNLGVISEIADDIVVMYAGRIVERASAADLFAAPRHPYTRGLIATLPKLGRRVERLPIIEGMVPDLTRIVAGCAFADRCPLAIAACRDAIPALLPVAAGHDVACIRANA